MAEQLESIILDVKFETSGTEQKLSEVTAMLAQLKSEQKALTKEIKAGNDADGEQSKRLTEVNAAIKLLTASQKAYSGQLDTAVEQNKQYGDSFIEVSAQCKALENQYKSLTKAQRESAEGQALKEALIQQKKALSEFDDALGNHQSHVGDYEGALNRFFPMFGKLKSGFSALGVNVSKMAEGSGSAISKLKSIAVAGFTAIGGAIKALGKALVANPILAVIAAALGLIVGAMSKLSAAMKKNDNAMTNLSAAFSIFKPIGTAVGKVFDTLGEGLSKLVLKLSEGAQAVGRFLEKIHLLPKGTSAAAEEAKQLVIAQDDLEESERNYTVNSAKRNKEIAQLRDQAAQSGDIKERLDALEQARKLEEANLEEEKEIAKERLRIAQEVAEQNNDTTDDTKNKIAELQAAVENAEANFANGVRRLDSQIRSEREAANKAYLARKKAQLDSERELYRAFEDARVALIEDDDERAYQSRKLQGEREIADLQQRLATDKTLTAAARDSLNNLIVAKQQQLAIDLEKIDKEAAEKHKDTWQDDAVTTTSGLVEEWKKAFDTLQKQREVDYARQRQQAGSNATQLAEIETNAALDSYEQLLSLDDAEKMALYGSQEAYELAVIESENRITEAQFNETQARMANAEEWTNTAMSLAQQASDLANALGDRDLSNYKKENAAKKADLDKRLAAGIISQEQHDAELARLDEELEQKEKENELKAAKRAKAIAIMETIINTAMGIAKAVSENPMFGGLPGSAIMAAAGALQLATIIAEPLPTAANGRYVVGPSHAGGGVHIEAEGGEAIINKRSTAMYKPLLSAINQAGGGVKFANGGMVDESIFDGAMSSYGGSGYEMMREAMTDAVAAMPSPTLVYEEFETFKGNIATLNEFAKI